MISATGWMVYDLPFTYTFTTARRDDTEITMASVTHTHAPQRGAVAHGPVSLVAERRIGIEMKVGAQNLRGDRSSITMAPSILESSNRRFDVNEMLSGKPSVASSQHMLGIAHADQGA